MNSRRVVIFGWAQSAHIQRWAQGLSERGYTIRVISQGGEPIDGIDTVLLPAGGRLSFLKQAAAASRRALEFHPDLIHVHYAGGFGVWGTRCRFSPLLVSVWGADIIDLPRNFLYRQVIRRNLHRADHISATSDMLRRVCIRLAPDTDGKVTVVPFGVRLPDRLSPLPNKPARVCFIKGHRRKYGPDVLLRAMAKVVEEIPDIRLTVAGEGELTPVLRSMTSKLGLDRNVEFVGYVDNRNIYSLLSEHHFMVMPSVMESESFGVAVLEASACSRAVIASDIGGVPEVLRDGQTGLLVPPNDVQELADTIIRLGRDSELCDQLGRAGYQFVKEKYTWDRSLDMMSGLYDRLIDGKA